MDLFPQHLGFRPDEPKVVKDNDACAEYIAYVGYTQKLLETYWGVSGAARSISFGRRLSRHVDPHAIVGRA